MLKKAAIAGAGVLLLMGLFFGRDACSYVSSSLGWAQRQVKDSIPIEFELQRAKDLINNLSSINSTMQKIARQEVDLDRRERDLVAAQEVLGESLAEIERLKGDLERGDSTYVYQVKTYDNSKKTKVFDREEVTKELELRWDRYRTSEETVNNQGKVLQALREGLDATNEKLAEMRSAKGQLKAEVAELETRLELVQAKRAASHQSFDHSRLSRTKDLVSDIRARLDVAEKMVNAHDSGAAGEIDLNDTASRDVLDEIARHLGEQSDGQIVLSDGPAEKIDN